MSGCAGIDSPTTGGRIDGGENTLQEEEAMSTTTGNLVDKAGLTREQIEKAVIGASPLVALETVAKAQLAQALWAVADEATEVYLTRHLAGTEVPQFRMHIERMLKAAGIERPT